MEKEEKLRALDAAIAHIEKQYGKGAVMKLGDPASQMNVETIPTGSLSLDIALGLGGIPKRLPIDHVRRRCPAAGRTSGSLSDGRKCSLQFPSSSGPSNASQVRPASDAWSC